MVAGKEVLYYNSRQTSSGCKWIRTSAQTPMVNKQEMLIIKKPCDNVRGSHADMKIWYSSIMMERFGRGVVMSWQENNIKTEEEGREEEVEDGKSKSEVRDKPTGKRAPMVANGMPDQN
ncbi:hypothetical protein J6590_087087 [Homalodisca vitripennis]|nr:hypothetical protein J6590_087087 [Homalodisca vitripennis]